MPWILGRQIKFQSPKKSRHTICSRLASSRRLWWMSLSWLAASWKKWATFVFYLWLNIVLQPFLVFYSCICRLFSKLSCLPFLPWIQFDLALIWWQPHSVPNAVLEKSCDKRTFIHPSSSSNSNHSLQQNRRNTLIDASAEWTISKVFGLKWRISRPQRSYCGHKTPRKCSSLFLPFLIKRSSRRRTQFLTTTSIFAKSRGRES